MRFLQILPMVLTGVTAALFDLATGKIPNGLILTAMGAGLGWQLWANGLRGLYSFMGGAAVPILLLGILFYFRMMGAGDIKLLAAMGGFLGPGRGLLCVVWSLLAGAVYAWGVLTYRQNLKERLLYFCTYMWNYLQTRKWEPYSIRISVDIGDNCLYFSIPVLISILLYAGGIY